MGELRRRKARDDKPFAVMVADLAAADRLCVLDEAARAVLTSPRRPIVLAPRAPTAGSSMASRPAYLISACCFRTARSTTCCWPASAGRW